MLDYTNLFVCSGCDKYLPMGTDVCPRCGYDYRDVEKSEFKKLFERVLILLLIIWILCSLEFVPQYVKYNIGSFCLGFAPLFVWQFCKLKKIQRKYESEEFYIKYGKKYVERLNKKLEVRRKRKESKI